MNEESFCVAGFFRRVTCLNSKGMIKYMRRLFFLILNGVILLVCVSGCVFSSDNKPVRFIVFGYAHMRTIDSELNKTFLQKIKEYKPEFAVVLGSILDVKSKKIPEELRHECDKMSQIIGAPLYLVPGEGTLIPSATNSPECEPVKNTAHDRFPQLPYVFRYKNNLFVALNSYDLLYGFEATDQRRKDFLINHLNGANREDNVFVISAGDPWIGPLQAGWFRYVHSLFVDKVKYVIGFGTHPSSFIEKEGVRYASIGCSPFDISCAESPAFLRFLVVEVKNQDIAVQVVPVPYTINNALSLSLEQVNSPYLYSQLFRKSQIMDSYERQQILHIDKVINTLQLSKGMTALDIGAGTGLFSFPIADALKQTGMVYATDVDEEMIRLLQDRVRERNYKNVSVVPVRPEGLDPFYAKHVFDRIFVGGVYDSILNPKEYFKGLRQSLKKKTGRLYIVHLKSVPKFDQIEFGDCKTVLRILRQEKPAFPLSVFLEASLQEYIQHWQGGDIPSDMRLRLVDGLNRALQDRMLWKEIERYYSIGINQGGTPFLERFVHPLDVRLARWLIERLESRGVFSEDNALIDEGTLQEVTKLNRILITGILNTDTIHWITTRRPAVDKSRIAKVLKDAGYELVWEHDFLAWHYFLEFKRDD